MKQIYKLTSTIKNPLYDKRCKYGERSIEYFTEGKTFVVWTSKIDSHGDCVDFGGRSIQGKLARDIIANSEPVQARTWHDIGMACGGYQNCADEVIDRLLSDGILSAEQVAKALNDFLES